MKPANLFDPPGHSDDASSFRAGLDEIRSASDVDVGEYFDGSDALPKRAKGRIVDIVGDSKKKISATDAPAARDALRDLDDVSDADINHFIDNAEISGVKFLSEVDQGTVDNVFDIDVDTDGYDIDVNLNRQVRTGLANSYGANWLEGEDISDITDDIADLDANNNVEGIPRVLNGLTDIDSSGDLNRVRGATYEMRIARELISDDSEIGVDLNDGETLRLGYKPSQDSDATDVDYTKLESDGDAASDEIKDIADRVYGSDTEENIKDVREALNLDSSSTGPPEFDGYVIETDGSVTYFEMKNWKDGSAKPSDIQKKASRFLAYQKLRGESIENIDMEVYVRTDGAEDDITGIIDEDWYDTQQRAMSEWESDGGSGTSTATQQLIVKVVSI